MTKLSKAQRQRRDALLGELMTLQVNLEQAQSKYTTKLVEAQAFCREVADDIEAHITDKSDKWCESERGQAFHDWLEAWQNVEFPEVVELDGQAADVLGDLDEEPAT